MLGEEGRFKLAQEKAKLREESAVVDNFSQQVDAVLGESKPAIARNIKGSLLKTEEAHDFLLDAQSSLTNGKRLFETSTGLAALTGALCSCVDELTAANMDISILINVVGQLPDDQREFLANELERWYGLTSQVIGTPVVIPWGEVSTYDWHRAPHKISPRQALQYIVESAHFVNLYNLANEGNTQAAQEIESTRRQFTDAFPIYSQASTFSNEVLYGSALGAKHASMGLPIDAAPAGMSAVDKGRSKIAVSHINSIARNISKAKSRMRSLIFDPAHPEYPELQDLITSYGSDKHRMHVLVGQLFSDPQEMQTIYRKIESMVPKQGDLLGLVGKMIHTYLKVNHLEGYPSPVTILQDTHNGRLNVPENEDDLWESTGTSLKAFQQRLNTRKVHYKHFTFTQEVKGFLPDGLLEPTEVKVFLDSSNPHTRCAVNLTWPSSQEGKIVQLLCMFDFKRNKYDWSVISDPARHVNLRKAIYKVVQALIASAYNDPIAAPEQNGNRKPIPDSKRDSRRGAHQDYQELKDLKTEHIQNIEAAQTEEIAPVTESPLPAKPLRIPILISSEIKLPPRLEDKYVGGMIECIQAKIQLHLDGHPIHMKKLPDRRKWEMIFDFNGMWYRGLMIVTDKGFVMEKVVIAGAAHKSKEIRSKGRRS